MKKQQVNKIANIILIMGIAITLIGAMYIAVVQKEYAISGCFVLASALMGTLLFSKRNR